MPSLPSSLALTTIATNAQILSADHRNNYSAIQTGVNGLIDAFNDGVTGQFLSGVGSTVTFAYPPGYEYAYNEYQSNASPTVTTEATALTIVTASAVTFDGATPVLVEFFAPRAQRGTTNIVFALYDGSSSIGLIGSHFSDGPVRLTRRLTPAAATKTYSIRAYVDAGTGLVAAGVGGVGVVMPGFIRITKV